MSATDALNVAAGPLPVLMHDGSRLDWLTATYTATVALKRKAGAVIHGLSEAPELETLLGNGSAVYATEIRCPRTMLSRVEHTEIPEQSIVLDDAEHNDDLYLIPGIVAVRETALSASGLHPLIRGVSDEVVIPEGWWLARGGEYQFTPSLVNLLKFVRDSDGVLNPGTMSVEEAAIAGAPYFKVTLAAEMYDHRRDDRDIQIAALIAAFGQLPRSSMGKDGENGDCPLALALRATLEDIDPLLSDWDGEHFDSAKAATSMESFWIDAGEDD